MASLLHRGVRKLKRVAIRRASALRSPLRVCVVGYGEIAPDHVEAFEGSGIARVIGISDVRPLALASALDRWPTVRAYRDFRRMLGELRPDVVSVCTWPQSHAEIVRAAAEGEARGILCEKPLALTMAEIEAMTESCARRGVKLACGYQYRFHPTFVAAAEAIRSGRLGRVDRVLGCIQGSLANNGPHLIDVVRFLLGDPGAERVSCVCRREKGGVNRGLPAEESASGEVRFEGGTRFEFITGEDAPEFFRVAIEGEKGTLVVTPGDLKASGLPAPPLSPRVEARHAQFVQFLRWVKGAVPSYPAEASQAARSTEIVLALYESARSGGPVPLPLRSRGDVIREFWPGTAYPSSPGTPEIPPPSAGPADARLAIDGGRRAMPRRYPTGPSLGLPELSGLVQVIASGQLGCTDGRMVPALERAFAAHYGSPKAVASTSGTAAIHVALGALGLNPGDEVITTTMTDMGTVIPILACNCLPIFADVDPVTGNLTAETIARKLTARTRAVILVHLFGRPADLGPICDLLRDRGVALIEDCSQAHDAEYSGRKVGTFGDFGTFSFQQSKQITCGDGGITLVNRPDLAQRAALFVDKGWDRSRGARSHLFLGMNYRMTELQGAVALAQLGRLPALTRSRRARAEELAARIASIRGIIPPPRQNGVDPSWWMFPFRIDAGALGVDADGFCEALAGEGVPARRRYLPVPLFEYDVIKFQRTYGDSGYPFTAFPYEPPDPADYPGTDGFNRDLLYLPWSQHVRSGHVAAIAEAVRKVAARVSRPAFKESPRRPEPEVATVEAV